MQLQARREADNEAAAHDGEHAVDEPHAARQRPPPRLGRTPRASARRRASGGRASRLPSAAIETRRASSTREAAEVTAEGAMGGARARAPRTQRGDALGGDAPAASPPRSAASRPPPRRRMQAGGARRRGRQLELVGGAAARAHAALRGAALEHGAPSPQSSRAPIGPLAATPPRAGGGPARR
jgi:hypothetical protein